MKPDKVRLIAFHCSARGIGFAVFEGEAIYDWGTVVARGDKNAMCLRKLGRLLDRFSPETALMEEVESGGRRADRILRLYGAIGALCRTRNIDVHLYNHADIQGCFAAVGATTRQEIAEAVTRHIDVLAPRLPHPRKPWQSEPRRMAIFLAAAVALAHMRILQPD